MTGPLAGSFGSLQRFHCQLSTLTAFAVRRPPVGFRTRPLAHGQWHPIPSSAFRLLARGLAHAVHRFRCRDLEHHSGSFSVTTGIDSLPDRIAARLKDAEL
jgi:hypothetical protein